jgi:hypothetical protein
MNTKFIKILIILVPLFLLFQCGKYEFPNSPYPRLETLSVTSITGSGATFQANLLNLGEDPILNHGFIWGTDASVGLSNGEKIELGSSAVPGIFKADINYGLYSDTTYYVKSFIETQKFTVYGKTVIFNSLGSMSPVINSFLPIEGTAGDTIELKGSYFSSVAKNNIVKFGTIQSLILSGNDSIIICIVPTDIPEKTVSLSVSAAGNKSLSKDKFTLYTPSIENFLPQAGTFDDIVQINGTHFNSVKEKNTVKFNDKIGEVLEASKTMLSVKVPKAIRTKDNKLSVTVNLQTGYSETNFTILSPSISSFTPNSGLTMSTIQINGNNFNTEIGGNTVLIGERTGIVLSATKTTLTVKIPNGIYNNRSFPVAVKVAEQISISTDSFMLRDIWLRKADVPHGQFGRWGATAFSLNGKGYVGLGTSGVGNNFWSYSPEENNWVEVAPFPGGERFTPVSFAIGNKAYVGLGGTSKIVSDFWSYDPLTYQWTSVANFPVLVSTGVGLSANGKGYVVTKNSSGNFYEYDPLSDIWTAKKDYPGSFTPDAGFVINDKIYIYATDFTTESNQLWKYDPITDTWTRRADQYPDNYINRRTTGFSVNGKGYIRGELHLLGYDPVSDLWVTDVNDGIFQRESSIAFVIDNTAYFGTSFQFSSSGSTSYDFWEFYPNF